MKRYILIKKPNQSRKTFQMFWDIRSSKTRRFEKIESIELNFINENFKSKILDLNEALSQVLKLKAKLLPKKTEDNFLSSNEIAINKLLNNFKKDRKIESDEAIELDYKRILKVLGQDSIVTISLSDLKTRIKRLNLSDVTKNRVILFTNKLLKSVGREEKIEKLNAEFETQYITERELELLLPYLSDIDQKITRIFFYTGLRLGELFGLYIKANSFNEKTRELKIRKQLKEDLYEDDLKRNSNRTIKISKIIEDDFFSILQHDKKWFHDYRNKFSKHLLKASRECFDDELKHISAHDLRHSFAMNCLEKGINISQIAKLLGNSISVCEKHYTSGTTSSRMLDDFEQKISA